MNIDTVGSIIAEYARQQDRLARIVSDTGRAAFIAGLGHEPDKRTLDEYLTEVEAWAERATDAGPAVLIDRYLRARHALVAVRVHNPSGRYLPKVMVEVHFEWDRLSSPKRAHNEQRFPAEPLPYGKPTPSALARSLSFSPPIYPSVVPQLGHVPMPRRSWTEKDR